MYDLVSQKFARCIRGTQRKALEETLITRFSKIQAKNGPMASDQSVRVKKLSAEAKVPRKGTGRAAGHHLYPIE